MGLIEQIWMVFMMNIRSISQRLWMSIATVVAIAIVAGMLLAFTSMANGFMATLSKGAAEDVLIIIRQGSQSELNSSLNNEQRKIISDIEGIALSADGQPIVSAELYVIVDGVKRSSQSSVNIPLRGVGDKALLVRNDIKIVKGRKFVPGRNEIIVGQGLLKQFSGFELDRTVVFGKSRWTVVGVFSSAGSSFEGELWSDARDVQSQFQRENSYQSIRVLLAEKEQLSLFKSAIEADPRLSVDIKTEAEYLAEQGNALKGILTIGWFLSIAMALGALAGALNTMYNSVASRRRDIATLRAIGFSSTATFFGTLGESLLLSVIGAVVGCIGAYFLFDGLTTATLGASFSQIVFSFQLTSDAMMNALQLSLAVGLIGGFFPAIRAARMPVIEAFR